VVRVRTRSGPASACPEAAPARGAAIPPMKMRAVFAGTPAFALPPLRALLGAHEVIGVLTQPDRPAGRGRALTASPVKLEALAHGVPVLQPARLRGDDAALAATLAQLREWRPDVIVVVAYGLILPPAILALPPHGCLNIHASLLPRWRGAAPIQRAILAGDTRTGVAIMRMDEGLDTGAVLLEESLPIGPETTAGELHDTLAALGATLLLRALELCAAGTAQPRPQPADGATYAAKLARTEALIDWREPAAAIDRRIRAFNPWPAAETRDRGELLKLLRSRLPPQPAVPTGAAPGTVLGLDGDALAVACGDGVVHVLELQRAGRRPVDARDYCNAERATPGGSPVIWG